MTDRYQRAPGVLWRRTPTAALVRSLDGRGWDLGGSGLALWDELAEPRTLAELVERMLERYEGDSTEVADDVRAAIRSLLADGVVVLVP